MKNFRMSLKTIGVILAFVACENEKADLQEFDTNSKTEDALISVDLTNASNTTVKGKKQDIEILAVRSVRTFANGELEDEVIYTYNDQGLVSRKETANPDPEFGGTTVVEYTYDEFDGLLETRSTSVNGEEPEIEEFDYDDQLSLISIGNFTESGDEIRLTEVNTVSEELIRTKEINFVDDREEVGFVNYFYNAETENIEFKEAFSPGEFSLTINERKFYTDLINNPLVATDGTDPFFTETLDYRFLVESRFSITDSPDFFNTERALSAEVNEDGYPTRIFLERVSTQDGETNTDDIVVEYTYF